MRQPEVDIYMWDCPKCKKLWPAIAPEEDNSFRNCPVCTYAWAAKLARLLRSLKVAAPDIGEESQ